MHPRAVTSVIRTIAPFKTLTLVTSMHTDKGGWGCFVLFQTHNCTPILFNMTNNHR